MPYLGIGKDRKKGNRKDKSSFEWKKQELEDKNKISKNMKKPRF